MPVRLRPVPDAPPRALGLVRVSKDREELISPELQRTAIEDHCGRRGYRLVGWIEGIDESGSQRSSSWWRKLDQAVEQVEQGAADVLVTWRFSRAARQRLKWAVAIDRVETAGGLLESATEPLDTSTASGRLARGMLAEFAAYEAETIGNTWREVHARRTSRGLPSHGKPRFGYRVVDGLHRPHEPEADVLAGLYRRYLAGESIRGLAAWLNREGVRTVPGYSPRGPGPWSTEALRRVLDSGFGAGFIIVAGSRQRGIHEPVIDAATWEAYLAGRAARRTLRRSESSSHLLSGMVRCVHPLADGTICNSSMGAGRIGTGKWERLAFRCSKVASQRGRHPGSSSVTMAVVEAAVMDWLRERAARADATTDAAAVRRARQARRKVDAEQLAREVLKLDSALAQLEVNRAGSPEVPVHVWDAARTDLLDKRKLAEERRLIARAEARQGEPAQAAARLLADWEMLSTEQLRAMLRQLIARVEVVPQRPRAQVEIVPVWAG